MAKRGKRVQPPLSADALRKIKDPVKLKRALGEFMARVSAEFKPRDLAHSLQYLHASIVTLREDHERSYAGFEEAMRQMLHERHESGHLNPATFKSSQFWLRISIRTFVSEVDGTAWALRQVVLWAHERAEVVLSSAEEAQLREQPLRSEEGGPRRLLRGTEAIAVSLAMASRLARSAFDPKADAQGWQAMGELYHVRNQITHPKELIKLHLDPKVLYQVFPRARRWWYTSLRDALGPLAPTQRDA